MQRYDESMVPGEEQYQWENVVRPLLAAMRPSRVCCVQSHSSWYPERFARWSFHHKAQLEICDTAPEYDTQLFFKKWTSCSGIVASLDDINATELLIVCDTKHIENGQLQAWCEQAVNTRTLPVILLLNVDKAYQNAQEFSALVSGQHIRRLHIPGFGGIYAFFPVDHLEKNERLHTWMTSHVLPKNVQRYIDSLEEARVRVGHELDEHRKRHAPLVRALDVLRRECVRIRQAMEQKQEKKSVHSSPVQKLDHQKKKEQEIQATLDRIMKTRSFRYTAPLRKIGAMLKL